MSDEATVRTGAGKDYIIKALANAKQFLKDARTLVDSGSFGHSAALSVLAMEEAAKAKTALKYLWPSGELEIDIDTYRREFKSHDEKIGQIAIEKAAEGLAKLVTPEGTGLTLKETLARVKSLMKGADMKKQQDLEIEFYMTLVLPRLKEKWLYVDIEGGEVMTPLTWSRKDALTVLDKARKQVNSYLDEVKKELRA